MNRQKYWREANKEYVKEYNRAYRENNSEKLKELRKVEHKPRIFKDTPSHIVYAWVGRSGETLYVGRGNHDRPRSHKSKPWWTSDLLLVTMTCKDEWESMEWEGKWGGRLHPTHNKEGYRRIKWKRTIHLRLSRCVILLYLKIKQMKKLLLGSRIVKHVKQ